MLKSTGLIINKNWTYLNNGLSQPLTIKNKGSNTALIYLSAITITDTATINIADCDIIFPTNDPYTINDTSYIYLKSEIGTELVLIETV